MADEPERLARLRREVDRSLRSLIGRTTLSIPGVGSSPERRGPGARGTSTSETAGPVTVQVSFTGGVAPDDERQVRALAKEIRRLIAEDRRRGLGG